jgi:hypothetical protein
MVKSHGNTARASPGRNSQQQKKSGIVALTFFFPEFFLTFFPQNSQKSAQDGLLHSGGGTMALTFV